MRSTPPLIAVLVLLCACAPDDQEFNISALIPRHQEEFKNAAQVLNQTLPRLAHFTFSDDAISEAHYGVSDDGARARTYPDFYTSWTGHHIRFDPYYIKITTLSDFPIVARHELCHVLGFTHDNGDPPGGYC